MLPLDSARWDELDAAGGDPLLVPRLIQSLTTIPTEQDWAEVWEQLSHQWTGYSCAFAAVPYLVQLGRQPGIATKSDFLLGLGRTVDAAASLGAPPADLKSDYEAVLGQAALIVESASHNSAYTVQDYVCVLHAAAALSGRAGLGARLFFSLSAGSLELQCPECETDLLGAFEGGGLVFQSVDRQMKPLSERAWVRPGTPASGAPDDFVWLAGLCTGARQMEVLRQVCLLYGKLTCPLRATETVVIFGMEQ